MSETKETEGTVAIRENIARFGGYSYRVFGRLVGKWGGDTYSLPMGEKKQISSVMYLKVQAEKDNKISMRFNATQSNGQTQTQTFVCTPSANGELTGASDSLRNCDITLREGPSPNTLSIVIDSGDGKILQLHTLNIGNSSCAYTVQYFAQDGSLTSVCMSNLTRYLVEHGRTDEKENKD